MARRPSPRFPAYVALVLFSLCLVQLAGSLLFYQAIDRQTLREDHARRVAELLIVSDRIYAIDTALTSPLMTTGHLDADVSRQPSVVQSERTDAMDGIASQIVEWEPALGNRPLHLATVAAPGGRRDLVGSIRMADGAWLNFRSRDINSMWPVALRAIVLTLVTALACVGIGLLALHVLTRPLRRLSLAAEAIGHGQRVPIREEGPPDFQDLARSMNIMQERISRLLEDQARSFEAISHDLRTPLSRQKISADLIDDEEVAQIVRSSVNEMESLLASLQGYLRAQHLPAIPERVDLGELIKGVLAPFGESARLTYEVAANVETFVEPLSLALEALVHNAIQFGHEARVTARSNDGRWLIEIEDSGPGIPAEHFEDVLTPFFRLDEARSRDTGGFGLGIPMAHRLMMRFGGSLSFSTSGSGGAVAILEVPIPARS